MVRPIPYGHQSINDSDIAAVERVLRSDWITQGQAVPAFEQALVERTGAGHGVAVNSGTSALHLACLSLGVGPGDEVWTVANTFVASANCARYCGAEVDFVDIDVTTGNLCVESLERKLRGAAEPPKVLIPVHFAGQPCDMATIAALADNYGFRVIEDASHALGARYDDGRAVGCCRYSDITVFSFHPVKMITTGEGGALMMKDADLAGRARRLRSHGIERGADKVQQLDDDPWAYRQNELGFNYRMTDIQAALGLSQLARLDDFVSVRRSIADRYDQLLAELPITSLKRGRGSSIHLYVIQVSPAQRRLLFDALRAAQVGVNVHYIPVYWQPYYAERGFRRGYCPACEQYYSAAISLPVFPDLTDQQQDYVVSVLGRHFGGESLAHG